MNTEYYPKLDNTQYERVTKILWGNKEAIYAEIKHKYPDIDQLEDLVADYTIGGATWAEGMTPEEIKIDFIEWCLE